MSDLQNCVEIVNRLNYGLVKKYFPSEGRLAMSGGGGVGWECSSSDADFEE